MSLRDGGTALEWECLPEVWPVGRRATGRSWMRWSLRGGKTCAQHWGSETERIPWVPLEEKVRKKWDLLCGWLEGSWKLFLSTCKTCWKWSFNANIIRSGQFILTNICVREVGGFKDVRLQIEASAPSEPCRGHSPSGRLWLLRICWA